MHIEDFNFEESDVRRTNDELSLEQKAIVDNGIRNEQIQNFTSTSSETLKTVENHRYKQTKQHSKQSRQPERDCKDNRFWFIQCIETKSLPIRIAKITDFGLSVVLKTSLPIRDCKDNRFWFIRC